MNEYSDLVQCRYEMELFKGVITIHSCFDFSFMVDILQTYCNIDLFFMVLAHCKSQPCIVNMNK